MEVSAILLDCLMKPDSLLSNFTAIQGMFNREGDHLTTMLLYKAYFH